MSLVVWCFEIAIIMLNQTKVISFSHCSGVFFLFVEILLNMKIVVKQVNLMYTLQSLLGACLNISHRMLIIPVCVICNPMLTSGVSV